MLPHLFDGNKHGCQLATNLDHSLHDASEQPNPTQSSEHRLSRGVPGQPDWNQEIARKKVCEKFIVFIV